MKLNLNIIIFSAVFITGNIFCAAGAFAAKEDEQVVEAVDCVSGSDTRRLEVLTKAAGCTLHYFKFGKSQEIAKSRSGVEICKSNLKKTRTKLEASGYQCK